MKLLFIKLQNNNTYKQQTTAIKMHINSPKKRSFN